MDQHHGAPLVDRHPSEAKVCRTEPGLAVGIRRMSQRAVEIVGSSVIPADEAHTGTLVPLDDGIAAMPADIEKSVEAAVPAAHDDDGIASNLSHRRVSRIFHLVERAEELPTPRKDRLKLEV